MAKIFGPNRPSDKILDIGGDWDSSEYLPPLPPKNLFILNSAYHGLEEDSENLNICAEAEKIPLPDNSFAVVLAKQLYGYLSEPQLLIQEMIRVLSPGGRLILIDFIGQLPESPQAVLKRPSIFLPDQLISSPAIQQNLTQVETIILEDVARISETEFVSVGILVGIKK